ncbi:hypothetical protein FRC08_016926, partial [Ceratobasidium sp. 394]
MTIGQIRALPSPVSPAGDLASDSHPSLLQGSNSSLASGSAPTTTTATVTPRRLPLVPSRSQISLPLENHSRVPSRTPSPSPRNASGNTSSTNTVGPVPTTGSVPLPPSAPNPAHPLPPLPPRPALTATTSSATLASTFSTASTTTLSPVTPSSAAPATTPSSVSLSAATSAHGVPGPSTSASDLMNTGANTSTQKEAGGVRPIPQVMVHAAADSGLSSQGSLGSGQLHALVGTGSQSQISPVSSSSPSDSLMQTAPASPYLAGPPSPAAPLSPQSSGGPRSGMEGPSSQPSPSGLGPQSSPVGPSPQPSPTSLGPHATGSGLGSPSICGPNPTTGLPSPSSPSGFAARFGKKKRQLSKDLLKRGGMSCEDLSIHVEGIDGGEGEIVRMIPQHHMQTMGLSQPKRYPELAQDRNWGTQPQTPSSPTLRPQKLNLGLAGVFGSRVRKESTQGASARRPSSPGTGTSAGFGFTAPGGKDGSDEGHQRDSG